MKRDNKGVAGIVAGVFLAAILFSSGFIYFMSVTDGQVIRSKGEIEAQAYENDKLLETFEIRSLDNLVGSPAETVQVRINNTGPIPVAASYLILYDIDGVPVDNGNSVDGLTVNAGADTVVNYTTPLSPPTYDPTGATTYRIDLISERGNIESTTWPPPPLFPPGSLAEAVLGCEECTAGFAEEAGSAAEAALAQDVGSIILDFDSFGAIFPDYGTKDNIDQTGWDVCTNTDEGRCEDPLTSEPIGTVGYPAFRLPNDENAYLIVRVKNKDYSLEDFNLSFTSGLLLSVHQQPSQTQNPPAYVCSADRTTKTVADYDPLDPNKSILMQNSLGIDDIWYNVFFCDTEPERGTSPQQFKTDWQPTADNSDVNLAPVFMVLRGSFDLSNRLYGQTIPYQGVYITLPRTGGNENFNACLKSTSTNACNHGPSDSYQKTVADAQTANAFVYVRVEDEGTAPFRADWVYPTGIYYPLSSSFSTTPQVTIPWKMPDPDTDPATWNNSACYTSLDDPGCDWIPIEEGFYAVQVSDFDENVYYATFWIGEP